MPLEEAQNSPNHKSGHLVKDSYLDADMSGTSTPDGLFDLHKNTELQSPNAWAQIMPEALPDLYSTRHACRWDRCSPLHLQRPLVTGTSCWRLAWITSTVCAPFLCVTCIRLFWLIGEISPNKPGIVERHKCVWVTVCKDAFLFMTHVTKESPHENTARMQQSPSQAERYWEKPNLPTPWSWTSSL